MGRSTSSSLTMPLPLLFEEDDMNASRPRSKVYVPSYRPHLTADFESPDETMRMPSFAVGAAFKAAGNHNSTHIQNQGFVGIEGINRFGSVSPMKKGTSAAPMLRGSPVPSVVSSEYSVSPYSFDVPSSISHDNASGTPRWTRNNQSPYSPPESQYYFTPVNAGDDETLNFFSPEESIRNVESQRELASNLTPRNYHSNAPQCRPNSANLKRAAPFPGSPTVQNKPARKMQTDLKVPLSSLLGQSKIHCDANYLCRPCDGIEGKSRSASAGGPLEQSSLLRARSSNDPATSAPLPQNLKGDPHRQAKVKTELCLFFSRGKKCPFGPRCNYAHGEDELKYTKLFELQKAGLVDDINSYRTHPCFSWISTGAW